MIQDYWGFHVFVQIVEPKLKVKSQVNLFRNDSTNKEYSQVFEYLSDVRLKPPSSPTAVGQIGPMSGSSFELHFGTRFIFGPLVQRV